MDPPWVEHGSPACKASILAVGQRARAIYFNLTRLTKDEYVETIVIVLIIIIGGDPSAGSPTDTLWRLNLPRHIKVLPRRVSP